MSTDALTPHGQILEEARKREPRTSQRAAARAAGISEGWWRQVVTGYQKQSGVMVPINPSRDALIAMARAVGADVSKVLEAAGKQPLKERPALDDNSVVLGGEDEDLDVIRAAIAATPASDRLTPTLDDVRDRLDAALAEVARARRMIDRLGVTKP